MDITRKKLYFRSCHRGTKEMDIIFSRFAEVVLPQLGEEELDDYQRLLDFPDDKLFRWVLKNEHPPSDALFPLMKRFLSLDYMRD